MDLRRTPQRYGKLVKEPFGSATIEYYSTPLLPKLSTDFADYFEYTVKVGDRIDSIAFDVYQDPALWWVIAWANEFDSDDDAISAGDTIRVPIPSYVFNRLVR